MEKGTKNMSVAKGNTETKKIMLDTKVGLQTMKPEMIWHADPTQWKLNEKNECIPKRKMLLLSTNEQSGLIDLYHLFIMLF